MHGLCRVLRGYQYHRGFRGHLASPSVSTWKSHSSSQPSLEAIARAQASVLEIERLLLGSKADRETVFDRSQAQLPCHHGKTQGTCNHDEAELPHSHNEAHLPRHPRKAEPPPTTSSFSEVNLSPLSIKALHDVMGYKRLTSVQEATLSTILQGNDVVVKAKAGTGKTLAYLLPAIEVLQEACPSTEMVGSDIISLILCPSRELALQIFTQARTLLQFHTEFTVKVLTGGVRRVTKERETLQASLCQILVATPGRLLDHLEKTEGFRQRLQNLRLLVLDEADHVLDVGFRRTIEHVLTYLPSFRQTLLFSATIPREIRSIAKVALKDAHRFIDMVDLGDAEIQDQVQQKCIVAPVESHLPILHLAFREHMELHPNYKVLVFCITSRITAFMHQLFKELCFNCMEIHSRKSQASRFHTYKDFRDSQGSTIMFTSDVSSRGLDYPNVTLVVQVGLPERGGTYINRIGRTGRCGKDGESLLLLTPWEEFFLEKIENQPIERVSVPQVDGEVAIKIASTLSSMDTMIKWHAYRTWLGYYSSLTNLPLRKETIVDHANEYSASIGFETPPVLFKKMVSKMGLRGVRGLRINKKAKRRRKNS